MERDMWFPKKKAATLGNNKGKKRIGERKS